MRHKDSRLHNVCEMCNKHSQICAICELCKKTLCSSPNFDKGCFHKQNCRPKWANPNWEAFKHTN